MKISPAFRLIAAGFSFGCLSVLFCVQFVPENLYYILNAIMFIIGWILIDIIIKSMRDMRKLSCYIENTE